MNKLYIGNEQTIYNLTNGKEIVLSDSELEELLQSCDEYHDLKIENERYETLNKEDRVEIFLLNQRIKRMKDIHEHIEKFNNHAFNSNTKVIYKDKEYEVLSVNFEEKLIQLINEDWVRCESCQII